MACIEIVFFFIMIITILIETIFICTKLLVTKK